MNYELLKPKHFQGVGKLGLFLLARRTRQGESGLPRHHEHIRDRRSLAKNVSGLRRGNLSGGIAADGGVNGLNGFGHGFDGLI
ncbi:MAG: hypothetical protein ABI369_03755 [Acetobacteraceae bacterium]